MEARSDRLYSKRFNEKELRVKKKLWMVLIDLFLSRFIDREGTVVDLGAGSCEFINQVQCKRRIAVDSSPSCRTFAAKEVEVFETRADHTPLGNNEASLVLASNFFEHLNSRNELLDVVAEAHRILKPGGHIAVIGPNVKYAYREYWDFCDHILPISDKGMSEYLSISGFEVVSIIPKFLPFTTKKRISQATFLLNLYLRVPILWKIFGKQFFILAKKIQS